MGSNNGAGVLGSLAEVNGEVAIVLQAGAVVLPLVKGLIKEIKAGLNNKTTVTIEYQTAVEEGQTNLDHTMAIDDKIIADVNAELVRQGAAPLPVEDSSAPSGG